METPERLRYAVVHNKIGTVKLLIERHSHLLENIDSSNGWSNLHYATFHGHYDICVYLINSGHDRHEVSLTHKGESALHLAASTNQERTLHYLAQHIQRSIDWHNHKYQTALMVATENGHDPCVNLLLDFGADMNKGDRKNTRPLHVAAAYGHVKIIRTLVDRNADALTPNADGWTPLDFGYSLQVQAYMRTLILDYTATHRVVAPAAPSTPIEGKFFPD